jgi:type IV pilus assembly protein PilN
MIRINLLPVKAAQKKERLRGQMIVAASSLVATGVACGVVYAALLGNIRSQQAEIADKEAEISRLKKDIGEVGHFKNLQKELQGKLDVLAQLKAARSGPVKLIDELSRALPEKVWLTSFKESGGSISISGVGLNEEVVAEFLRNLEISPQYKQVELSVVEQMTQDGQKLHKFDITSQAESAPSPALVADKR